MKPSTFFLHCPRCGAKQDRVTGNVLSCPSCGFRLYFNPAVAVAVYLQDDQDRVLLARRMNEPAKGKLVPPGGFVDIGETAEAAVRREVMEEVGLEMETLRFLCSQTNVYPYCEVSYPVLDLFFTARALRPADARGMDGMADPVWLDPRQIDPEQLAFESMRQALGVLIQVSSGMP